VDPSFAAAVVVVVDDDDDDDDDDDNVRLAKGESKKLFSGVA